VDLPTPSRRRLTLRTRVKEQGECNTKAISAIRRAVPAFAAGESVINGEEGGARKRHSDYAPTHPSWASVPNPLRSSMPLQ
jgi:hypothetical protein